MNRPRAAGRLFVLLLAVMAVYRLTLLDRGTMAFVDETMYFKSVMALQALSAGDVRGALTHIASNNGRPGAALVKLPVAALQAIPFAFGVAPSNPRSLLIPAVFNVIVSLATLYLFFNICVVVCSDAAAALTAAFVYALLVNTNLYVRHMLPYDWALCLCVYAIWLAVTRRRTAWLAAGTGLLAGATITIYPGYFLLAMVPGIAIAGQEWSDGSRRAAHLAAVFAVAVAMVIAATELLCLAGGVSYVESARALSRTITQGAFDEGWTFLPAYLVEVERLSGLALLAGTAAYLWQAASHLDRQKLRPIDWLFLPALAGCAWQAASSAQWQSMVLYGRLIHPWMLFMALALGSAIAAIDRATRRTAVCAAVATAAVISWVSSARAYYHLAYPADVLYSLRIDTTRLPPDRMRCELQPGTSYASPGPLNRATRYPYSGASNYILINFCQGAPTLPRPTTGAGIGDGATLYDGPHWLTFPAYGFEGLPPAARAALVRNGYRVRAFRVS